MKREKMEAVRVVMRMKVGGRRGIPKKRDGGLQLRMV